MNPDTFRAELADYILSGHAYLHCPTTESTCFLSELKAMADELPDGGRQVFTWSQAVGWQNADGNPPAPGEGVQFGQSDPQKVAQEILDLPEESIFVLKDFGWYLDHKKYSYADVVIAWLCEVRDVLAATGRTVLFVGADFDVPPALANDVTTVDFPLPDDSAIAHSVRFVMDGHAFDDAVLPSIVSACRGMTQQQVEDRTALALRRFKTLNSDAASLILHEKAEVLRRSGLLKYCEPPAGGLALIGGNDNVKRHIARDKACFGDAARAGGSRHCRAAFHDSQTVHRRPGKPRSGPALGRTPQESPCDARSRRHDCRDRQRGADLRSGEASQELRVSGQRGPSAIEKRGCPVCRGVAGRVEQSLSADQWET